MPGLPVNTHIHLSQNKYTSKSVSAIISSAITWSNHMECVDISNLMWSLVHTEHSRNLENVMLWSGQPSKWPQPSKDYVGFPALLDICVGDRGDYLAQLPPFNQTKVWARGGPFLQSLEPMPWGQAAGGKTGQYWLLMPRLDGLRSNHLKGWRK